MSKIDIEAACLMFGLVDWHLEVQDFKDFTYEEIAKVSDYLFKKIVESEQINPNESFTESKYAPYKRFFNVMEQTPQYQEELKNDNL